MFTEIFLLLAVLVVSLIVGRVVIGRFSESFADASDAIRKLFVARRVRGCLGKNPSTDRVMAMIVAIRTAQRHFPTRRPWDDPQLSKAEALIRDQFSGLGEDALREALEGLIRESHFLWLQIALETVEGPDAAR